MQFASRLISLWTSPRYKAKGPRPRDREPFTPYAGAPLRVVPIDVPGVILLAYVETVNQSAFSASYIISSWLR